MTRTLLDAILDRLEAGQPTTIVILDTKRDGRSVRAMRRQLERLEPILYPARPR